MTDRETYRTMVAVLLDHFHLSLDEIGRLTDSQIKHLYFAKRDEMGSIVADSPKKPTDPLKEGLMQLDMMAAYGMLERDKLPELKEQLRAKWLHLK